MVKLARVTAADAAQGRVFATPQPKLCSLLIARRELSVKPVAQSMSRSYRDDRDARRWEPRGC